LWAIGKIVYRDETEGVRRTGFARYLDPRIGRFTAVRNDPDYEYKD
jgi:hypothetical protein